MHAAFGFFKTREQSAKAQPSTAQHRAVVVISVNKHNPIRPVTVHISTVEAVDLTEPAPMQVAKSPGLSMRAAWAIIAADHRAVFPHALQLAYVALCVPV